MPGIVREMGREQAALQRLADLSRPQLGCLRAQASHVLALEQAVALPLGRLALGDVAQEAGEARWPARPDARDGQLDGERRAVRSHPGQLQAPVEDRRLLRRDEARERPAVQLAVLGRDDELGQRPPDRVLAPVAEGVLRSGVEVDDPPVVSHRDDAVERGADDRGAQLLRGREPLLDAQPGQELADLIAEPLQQPAREPRPARSAPAPAPRARRERLPSPAAGSRSPRAGRCRGPPPHEGSPGRRSRRRSRAGRRWPTPGPVSRRPARR